MAVPKRKMSRSNTRARRAQWKATEVALVETRVDGQTVRVPRRLIQGVKRGLVTVED